MAGRKPKYSAKRSNTLSLRATPLQVELLEEIAFVRKAKGWKFTSQSDILFMALKFAEKHLKEHE